MDANPLSENYGFAKEYAASRRKSGAENALISVSLDSQKHNTVVHYNIQEAVVKHKKYFIGTLAAIRKNTENQTHPLFTTVQKCDSITIII